ncbi:MAG: hypothetical protein K6C12_13765 [Oscillospiraceae bacterium]|nr:hypothetical protein [Oscillospiraceae bacterium]
MKNRIHAKLAQSLGVARLVVILAVAALVLFCAALYPVIQWYRFRADALGCLAALTSSRNQLIEEYLFRMDEKNSAEEAKEYVAYAMVGWDDLCPGGGTTYIVEKKDTPEVWDVVCGLHGEDRKQCTRLNAEYVLDQLRKQVRVSQVSGTEYPESLTVTLHHKPLTATLTAEDTGIRRGTSATMGVSGTVVSYAIAGYSDFGRNRGVADGEICWFSYADKEHCANWSAWEGWTGDSYRDY